MMTDVNPDWLIAACGLNCGCCGLREDGNCDGCKSSSGKHHCADCEILNCSKEKELENCAACDDFPCEIIEKFATDGHDHHRISIENLKQIKQHGLQQWLNQQEKPMFCPGWIV